MAAKARRDRQAHPHAAAPASWASWVQTLVLAGVVALVVSAALVPSEAAITEGTYAPHAAVACILLLSWFAAAWLGRQPSLVLGWTEIFGAALIGWHSLAAIVSLGHVNGRQALNALWLIIGYGATTFLIRQCLRSAAQIRALLVTMIWLATLLASLGLYQYFYSMPALRRQYEANPEQVLAENGYPTEKNSPQRTLFENRLRSVEPLATFALTNSLAGFLAPWLVATLAIGLTLVRAPGQRQSLIAAAIIAIGLAGCLVLTKSRTAYLATLLGLPLVAMVGSRRGWSIDWRIPTVAAGVLLVIGLSAVALGGLDVEVMSEAPKSVLYRLEYWQATGALIADHSVFGAGPGNFQAAYAAYKLPQASEMIADPHNFLLEMWANAGTPAIVLLLLMMIAFIRDLTTARSCPDFDPAPADERDVRSAEQTIFGGALVGLLAAMPLGLLVGYPLELLADLPVVWLLGIPLLAAAWWLCGPWVAHGRLTLAIAIVPLVVLFVNLLAAGALFFPGVMGTLLVLVPVASCIAGESPMTSGAPEPTHAGKPTRSRWQLLAQLPRRIRLSSLVAGLVTFAAACLAVACLRTEYHPILNSQAALHKASDALRSGDSKTAENAALAAVAADRQSPEPWRLLAEMRLARWQTSGAEQDWEAFAQAATEFQKRDPGHHAAYYTRGNWHLAAWRKRSRPEDLSEAVAAYGRACMFYPNRALYHAQLAWALHLGGEESLAAQEAERAKSLDDLMPHQEQKLSRQQIYDPDLAKPGSEEKAASAEQIVSQLRTTDKEKSP